MMYLKKYDWIFACSTETSCGLKLPIEELSKVKLRSKCKINVGCYWLNRFRK